MVFYYAQIHSNQLEYQDNRIPSRTITINLLDFNYLNANKYFNKITIPSKTENTIELYILELPKLRASRSKKIEKQEAWILYLRGELEEETTETLKQFGKIKKLDDLLENFWRNETME